MLLVTVLVDGLVDLFVIPNACSKIERRLLWILAFVIRTRRLDISYVCHDQILVVTLGLNIYDLNAGIGADL